MAGFDLPHRAIREQIVSAVDLIVHLERMPDGKRQIVKITEVQGLEQQTVVMQDIFTLQSPDGTFYTALRATGIRPKILDKLERNGVRIPLDVFHADFAQANRRSV
jgi:pilus assembly protein CpaF